MNIISSTCHSFQIQQVVFVYHGKTRYFGRFDTPEQAAVAKETARRTLINTRASDLNEDEIEQNLLLARQAAAQAASEMGDVTQGGEENSDNEESAASTEKAFFI